MVPVTSGVLTGELRWRLVTFEAVASVGDLSPVAVLAATRCDDDRDGEVRGCRGTTLVRWESTIKQQEAFVIDRKTLSLVAR